MNQTETGNKSVYAQAEEIVAHRYENTIEELKKQQEYEVFKASADAKIKGQAMQEHFQRLLRVMFLRQTKDRLKPMGLWTRYCQDTGIDIKNADYEIDKLGDFRDELLVSFGAHVGYEINKIRYLTSGDSSKCSEKLGVTIRDGEIFVGDERIPLTPDDVQFVVNKLQDDLARQQESATKEKESLEKDHAETRKALKRVERELKKIKGDAEKKGMSPEEAAFLQAMDEVKERFDTIIERIDKAGFNAGEEATPRMTASAKTVIEYMKQRLADVWVRG